jgi:hypothetical protein
MLMRIPEELVPFAVVALGATMLVIITILHGAGLDLIVTRYKRKSAEFRDEDRHPRLAVLVFARAVLLMLVLHLSEICIWGLVLRGGGLVHNLHEAVYFSANAYTTLGMGSMALSHNWHELSPMIAIAGLFTFAWTTSELFNIVGEQHDLVAALSARRQKPTPSNHK